MGLSNAERQARWRAKRAAELAALKDGATPLRNGKLQELAQAKVRIVDLEAELHSLRLHIRFGPKRRAAASKAEKPPLPPDEERDRQIKALRTRVRNLSAEVRLLVRHQEEMQGKTGAMDFRTRSAVMKVLHPDVGHQTTDEDRDEACRLFTQWMKADKDMRRSR